MNQKPLSPNLIDEMNKTKNVLEKILSNIMSINKHLESLEQELHKKEFISHGLFEKGVCNFIICLPCITPNSREFSVYEIIRKREDMFSLVWIDDLTESPFTCRRITKLVESQIKTNIKEKIVIVNLRWVRMISPLESSPTIIIGKRFFLADMKDIKRLEKGLNDIGVSVFEDEGEYGGGPLIYSLMKVLEHYEDVFLVELTLSYNMARNESVIEELFNLLSTNLV
jgi:hypothetical protein